MGRLLIAAALVVVWASSTVDAAAGSQATPPYVASRPFGTLREQAAVQQAWLKERLGVNLPKVMRDHGVDMWEGEPDGVERIALGGSSMGGLYAAHRTELPTATGQPAELWGVGQWRVFAQIVREQDPASIGVNISDEHNFADGLTAAEWAQMREALGPELEARVVRNPRLAIDYLAMRVPSMMQVYRRLQGVVHEVISAAFSNLVITPGVTTTDDVVWWMRQRVNDLGLHTWFQPSVSVQRDGASTEDLGEHPVIQRGDALHCDFGITAMGLNTDTQHMAYVLREGETDAPAGLQRALARANRLQDILLEQTDVGMSGNAVLHAVLEQMRAEGLDGTMYSHPIGDHGHGAGPLIGLWDYQEGVPGRGDVPVLANNVVLDGVAGHHAGGRVERSSGSHGARRGSGNHARRRDAVGAPPPDRTAPGAVTHGSGDTPGCSAGL